jgi:hypothetical protein
VTWKVIGLLRTFGRKIRWTCSSSEDLFYPFFYRSYMAWVTLFGSVFEFALLIEMYITFYILYFLPSFQITLSLTIIKKFISLSLTTYVFVKFTSIYKLTVYFPEYRWLTAVHVYTDTNLLNEKTVSSDTVPLNSFLCRSLGQHCRYGDEKIGSPPLHTNSMPSPFDYLQDHLLYCTYILYLQIFIFS